MKSLQAPAAAIERQSDLVATVLRERKKLGNFIRRRVRDPMEAEDLLQEVLQELVEAYRLPEPIEQASAWLYRIARNRIIDFFRKSKHRPPVDLDTDPDHSDQEFRLEVALPAPDGPEALYARKIVLDSFQRALDELPPLQRAVFIEHELEGCSFKTMSLKSGTGVNTLLGRKRSAVLYLRKRLQSVYDDLDS